MAQYPLTVEGYDNLKEELNDLKKVQRPTIIERIAEARSHGDLKENSEYHAAREKQSFIEGRIKFLEGVMADSEVIDVKKLSGDRVLFGATVTLFDVDSDDEVQYRLVGELESDLDKGKLSVTSPIGSTLIGKSEGDTVIVRTPAGEKEYEILDVNFI
jgi:transcription elongation factor GreA